MPSDTLKDGLARAREQRLADNSRDRPDDETAGGGGQTAPGLRPGSRRTVEDIAIQIVARAGNLVLGIVVTLILGRALGAAGFGAWSTIFAIAQIAASFGDLGLTQVAVSRAARDVEAQPNWLAALLTLRLLLSVPIFVTQLVAVLVVAPNSHVAMAGVLVAATAIIGAASSLTVAFQLRVRNDLSMLVITVNSVLWTGGVAAVAALTHDVRAFAAVFLAVNLVSTLLTVVLALRGSQVRFTGARRLWPPMLRIGIPLGAAGILVTLYVRLDQVLVFDLAGSREAGLYGAAYRILDQIQFLPISVMTTLFPLIASAYPADLVRVRRLLQSCSEYLSMASLGILAFTIVEARPLMVLLFGPEFAAAAPALPVLMAAFVSISFGYLAGNMVAVLNLQRRFFVFAGVGLVVNVATNVVLIPRYGFLAAAWTTLVTELVVMSLTMNSVLRTLNMRFRVTRLVRIAVVATAMGAVVWALAELGAELAELVAAAALAYPALLVVSGALSVSDVKALLARKA